MRLKEHEGASAEVKRIRIAARGNLDRWTFVIPPDRRRKGAQMRRNHPGQNLNTTLGDLIEAVSEVAFEYSENPREAYMLARLALVEILRNASHPTEAGADFGNESPRKFYVH